MLYRVGTRYHTQDTRYFCGAAVAMMLFEHLSIGGIPQNYLYCVGNHLSVNTDDFYIDPEGLKGLLNQRLEETEHPARYELRFCATALEAVQELAASLAQDPPLPGFTLDGIHWVLIDGVEHRNDAAAGARIGDLWIHDPGVDDLPPTMEDATPPHSALDPCGSSDRHGFSQAAYNAKAWSSFLKRHDKLSGVPLVIVPAPTGTPRLPLAEEDDAQSPLPGWIEESFPYVACSLDESITVQTPPEEGGDYQLAPLRAPAGRLGWALNANGKRKGIGLFSKPHPLDILTEEQAIEEGQRVFATTQKPLAPPDFTWHLSQESRSRFLPFREVRFDTDRTAFVRLDHKTFRGLSAPKKVD